MKKMLFVLAVATAVVMPLLAGEAAKETKDEKKTAQTNEVVKVVEKADAAKAE